MLQFNGHRSICTALHLHADLIQKLSVALSLRFCRGPSPHLCCRLSTHFCCRICVVLCCEMRCAGLRSEEHTSELQSRGHLVCRLLLEKKKRSQAGYGHHRGQGGH